MPLTLDELIERKTNTLDELASPKTLDELAGIKPKTLDELAVPIIPFSPGGVGFGVPPEIPGDMLERTGIPEIFKGIREIVAPTTPYTEREATQAYQEIPRVLENAGMRVLTLGGLAGPVMGLRPSELRAALNEDIRDRAGFAPALAPALGETALLAVEWGYLYPKMFGAVGATGRQIAKIPQVAKGMKALKALGGIGKVAEKYPRVYTRIDRGLKAFTKGATVGTIRALPEALGEELPPGEVLKHVSKSAAIMGGVATAFQVASEVDTVRYVKSLRKTLIRSSNQRFVGYLNEVGKIPAGAPKSAAYKSLASLKQTELRAIDKIVSQAEAQLLGLKKGKLYQKGQEQVEPPQKAAERLIKYGLEPGRTPIRGVEALEKGLGKTEPFIKMPMTRAAEAIETSKAAIQAVRHPIRAAEQAKAGKVRPTLPKPPTEVVPPPVVHPVRLEEPPEVEAPVEIAKRHAVEILPRKAEILGQIDEAIKKAPEGKDYDTDKKPKVHFEIDGGANVNNNKETLQVFRARVAKLPEKEMIPKARPKPAKKKPIAATREKVGELFKAPEGWFTDGRILVKGKQPTKVRRAEDWEKRTTIKIDDVIHAQTERAEFQHYAVKDPSIGEGISDRPVPHIEEPGTGGPMVVFKSGGKYFVYDQDRFNVIRNRYPDLEYGIKADTGLLVGYKGGFPNEPVAALMGITMDEAEGPGMVEPPVKLQPLPKEAIEEPVAEVPAEGVEVSKPIPAIQLRNGNVVTGVNHGEIIHKLKKEGRIDINKSMLEEGFVDGWVVNGKFYDTSKMTSEEVDSFLTRLAQPAKPEAKPAEAKEPQKLEQVVIDTFREWPKTIKPVGKDFWVELMAAAKKLLTPYRYKALRRNILGHFAYGKRAMEKAKAGIRVQDVRDALTVVHELGHNIDWLLNHKSFPSSIKDRFDVVADSLGIEIKERALRNELKAISKIIRPDMWGAREGKGSRYVNRHVELMADYISHYILDPEATRKVAPTMTKLLEKRLSIETDIKDVVNELIETRYEGPKEPAIAKTIREHLRMVDELKPLILETTTDGYIKQAEELGIKAARHHRILINRANKQAERINKLVPDKMRQTDLAVIAEKGEKNPWTGRTREQILKENPLTKDDQKALNLYHAYQELGRQTVNKYLRGAGISEYIKFLEDYFIHAYQTPITQKYRSAISKWAKRSPQAKRRVLPDLNAAVEMGLVPRAKTLNEGLMLWAGINYRVATNVALLKALPNITNDDGESILQKPKDKPDWPTVDYWPIRKAYAIPIKGRGVLLFQGRVAVDPKVKPMIDSLFGRMFTSNPAYYLSAINAIAKAFQLTVFSAFHHVAEFFSTVGGVGKHIFGLWGKSHKPFEDTLKTKILLRMPVIGPFYAGNQLKQTVDFMDHYIGHGGRTGYITGEGIGLIDKMLRDLNHYNETLMAGRKPHEKYLWLPYLPVKTLEKAHHAWQQFLWGTIVENGKLFTYYNNNADLLQAADKARAKLEKKLRALDDPIAKALEKGDKKRVDALWKEAAKIERKRNEVPRPDRIAEMSAQYVNNNYGGQEWLNTMFKNPQFRWRMFQIFRSWDWTYGQLKTPLYLTGRGLGARTAGERQLFRRIGRRHWLWYIAAIWAATQGLQYAINRKFTWENEPGHRLDVDYTKVWRWKDEIISKMLDRPNWKERGDLSRRYTVFGKAGREVLYWFREPLVEFGRKLSPIAETIFEQLTGYNVGSEYPAPWAREDLETYESLAARAKSTGEMVIPFSFRGNNALLALPLRKGMTRWKSIRAYQDIYTAKAKIAYESKFNIALLKVGRIHKNPVLLFANEDKLRKDIAEACKLNNVDAEKSDQVALSKVKSIYYGKLSRAANNREIEECNNYARALIELGATPKSLIQSIKTRGLQLSDQGREIEVEAFQKAAKKYFDDKEQKK